MSYHPQDIFIQKERTSRTVWLSHDMLLRVCNGLSDGYLRKVRTEYRKEVPASYHSRDILPNTGKSWRFARIDNKFYYCYENIPDKAPSFYRSQLPAQEDLLNNTAADSQQESDLAAHLKDYLKNHYSVYLVCYNDCTQVQQVNLAKAAAAMEAAVTWVREKNVNLKKYDFINEFTALLKQNDVPYLPQNTRVFKTKLQEIIDGIAIAEAIKLPRKGNSNAEKYNDEEVRSWVIQLRGMDGLNFTNAFIIRKIKSMCLLTSKPVPSDRWIGSIMEDHNTRFITAQERFGSNGKYSAIYRGYVPMQNALFAGDCWQVDGTRVNLIPHKAENGKNEFLYIIAVRDVHSGDVVGWHFDIVEDRWAVFNAIKMAVKETGYLPHQIVFDRFPGHNTQEMQNFLKDFEQCGVSVKFTYKASGKASLERWFGTLQSVFMMESKYYYGQGVMSRNKYAHRSKEYITRLRKEAAKQGFNWDAAVTEGNKIIEAYRNTAYCQYSRKHSTVQQSPAELHEASEKPNVIMLEPYQMSFLFGLKKKMQINHEGLIKTEILKQPFYFRITDYNIISKYREVLMCYDLDDLSQVELFKVSDNPIKQYLGSAAEETPAQVYGSNPEWNKVRKAESVIMNIDQQRKEEQQMKKAVGSDIVSTLNMLTPVAVKKGDLEASESAALNEMWNNNEPPAFDGDIDIDVRTQY